MNSCQILSIFFKIEWVLDKMKEFVKNSFNFKEKLKNILLRIKNSSQNKIFKKKKTLNTVIPCTGMHALKPKLLGNRCTIKHAF